MSWPLRLCLGLFSLLIIVPMPAPTLAQQASPAALPQQQEQTKRAPVIGQDKEQQQLQPAGGDTKAQNIFPMGQLPVALVEPKQRFSYQSQSTKRVAELAQQQPAVGGGKKRPELFSVPKERVPTARAQLTVRLKRHSNPSRRMQNATTCACPQSQQDEGNCGKEGGNRSPCYMAFTAVVSAADQTVDFRSTPFVVVDSTGIIDALREPEWGAKMEWALPAKPRFVDIYAYNLGPVFSLYDGRILSWSETVWPVDAWTVDLEELVPYSWAGPMAMATHRELSGRYDTESILNLDFSVQCLFDFMGPECDLRCQRENVNAQPEMVRLYGGANRLTNEVVRSPQPAQLPAAQMPAGGLGGEVPSGGGGGPLGWTICESALEQRRFFECHYRDGRRIQVDSCKFCEFGILNDSVCVHDPAKLRMEPDDFLFYKTGFIVLAVALAICLLILVLGCCIACWIFCCRRSAKDRRHSSAMGGGTYRRGAGAPYNISENGFGSNRLGDPLTHPLLTNSGQKAANGQIAVDWTKPAQPPAAVQRGILLQHPHHQHPHPPSSMSPQQQPGAGGGGEFGPMAASSPNTSESDYRPSPFTPRREAQV